MANEEIKEAIKKSNLKFWQIAYAYGLSDGNFSRKLRKELPSEEKQKIFDIISRLIKNKEE